MPRPDQKPKEPSLESLTKQLGELHYDMATCGYNSYGVKRTTYFSWVRRSEEIHKALARLVEKKSSAPTPPPPPVPAI